ncbi:MAG: C39 family peptidase [Methylococcales bacterium]
MKIIASTARVSLIFYSLIVAIQLGVFKNSLATTISIGSNTRVYVPLQSLKSLRDKNVVKQAYDYSCGAASLATLLSYGVGDKVTEREIMAQLIEVLPKEEEKIKKKEGFSLLDLSHVAKSRGHKSLGFRIAPQYLPKLSGPVIVYIKPRGYEHFAVLKGIRGGRVFLADPSLGNIRMPVYQFLAMWLNGNDKGIIFIVEANNGQWPADYPLKLKIQGLVQPEILSARQMLEIGSAPIRFLEITR